MERTEKWTRSAKKKGEKKRNKKPTTLLSRGLGKVSKILMVAVLIHYTLVLLQGDNYSMFNSVRAWAIAYI